MKIVKIGAVWCSGCLVMNSVFNKIKKNYNLDVLELDIDMDEEEVKKYGTFDVLPVFIVFEGEEEKIRIIGEHSYEEMIDLLKGVGVFDEKNN